MNKSVYSIVLSDDVVAEIDRLAYREGTSRSNMINQILAQYVSYTTPEKRLSDIFSKAVELVESMDQLQVMLHPSDTHLALKSALRYKYNPTVKYSVELYKNSDALGELRVTMRTQSRDLIDCMNGFFTLWAAVERSFLAFDPPCSIGAGRYSRTLRRPETPQTGEALGQAIIDYVETLDKCMKLYFAALPADSDPTRKIAQTYKDYMNNNLLLM